MSKFRWEMNDDGRVWTLLGQVARRGGAHVTYISGQPVGYLSRSYPEFWAVYQYDKPGAAYELVATIADLDEAKGLLQTLVGANHV